MRYHEITRLDEKVPFSPGSNVMIDLRDPDPKAAVNWDGKPYAEFVVLTKDGGAIVYRWAGGNRSMDDVVPGITSHDKRDWSKLYNYVSTHMDRNLQNSITDISIIRNGFMLAEKRDEASWGGVRSKLSTDFGPICQALLDRGLATRQTPIWVGNWAKRSEDSKHVGNVGSLIQRADTLPSRITLYHGTTNFRLVKIMRDGLRPLDKSSRIWINDTKSPQHRLDSIYLTSSMDRAEFYAKKAYNVDKARLAKPNFREPWRTNPNVPNPNNMSPDQRRDKVKELRAGPYFSPETVDGYSDYQVDQELRVLLRRHASAFDPDSPDKLEPIVLVITLGSADMKKLMADDDYIQHMRARGKEVDPNDWQASLNYHAQVAYRGAIPPSRIRLAK